MSFKKKFFRVRCGQNDVFACLLIHLYGVFFVGSGKCGDQEEKFHSAGSNPTDLPCKIRVCSPQYAIEDPSEEEIE